MRCLITGACGFVGTNLTLSLLRKGHQVVGCDSLSRKGAVNNYSRIRTEFPAFENQPLEIEDIPGLIYTMRPELVCHFAAQVAVTTSIRSPERDFKINGEGSFRIALAASKVGAPVIYTSTNKVFGDNVNHVPLRELDTRWDFAGDLAEKGISEDFPIDASHHTPYGASKLVGDIYVREFKGVVNRCSCMYGPNQFGISDQGWIAFFLSHNALGRQTTIYGDGKQVRDAVHSRDVVNLLEREAEMLMAHLKDSSQPSIAGEVFNVGGGYANTISLLELCKKVKLSPTPLKGSWRPADQKVFYCDISKAKRVLGWEPKVSLDEGIENLQKWTADNLDAIRQTLDC